MCGSLMPAPPSSKLARRDFFGSSAESTEQDGRFGLSAKRNVARDLAPPQKPVQDFGTHMFELRCHLDAMYTNMSETQREILERLMDLQHILEGNETYHRRPTWETEGGEVEVVLPPPDRVERVVTMFVEELNKSLMGVHEELKSLQGKITETCHVVVPKAPDREDHLPTVAEVMVTGPVNRGRKQLHDLLASAVESCDESTTYENQSVVNHGRRVSMDPTDDNGRYDTTVRYDNNDFFPVGPIWDDRASQEPSKKKGLSMASLDSFAARSNASDMQIMPKRASFGRPMSKQAQNIRKHRASRLYALTLQEDSLIPDGLKSSILWCRDWLHLLRVTTLETSVLRDRLPTKMINRIVNCAQFELTMFLIIILNALFIGFSTNERLKDAIVQYNHEAEPQFRNADQPIWVIIFDILFSLAFVLETVLRIISLEGAFFCGRDWRWNMFDFCVVFASLLDLVVLASSAFTPIVRLVKVVRVLRAVRAIRVLQFAPWMSKLRFMMLAIMNSLMPLIWACLVLMVFLYMVSVVLLQGVADFIIQATHNVEDVEDLKMYFGSLSQSMLSLSMSMSGGVDWSSLFYPLADISEFYGFVFIVFITVSVLAVFNIITSIFVTDAIEVAHMDIDLRMQGEKEQSRQAVKELSRIFHCMDTAKTGVLTSMDLEDAIDNEELRTCFALLGLQITDAVSFFSVLDLDAGGSVDISEFVMGCLRLKGKTNLIDMEVSLQEMKQMFRVALKNQSKIISIVRELVDTHA